MPVWMLRWPQRLSEALELTSLPLACTPQAQGPQGGGGKGEEGGVWWPPSPGPLPGCFHQLLRVHAALGAGMLEPDVPGTFCICHRLSW